MAHATSHPADAHKEHSHEEHHHEDLSFWKKYVFSSDHKVIGLQYLLTSMLFMALGFGLMLIMRWQLAFPGKPLPVAGFLLENLFAMVGQEAFKDGVLQPDFYNVCGAMHGTIMIFLAVVPIGFAAFGNYVVPLQIGAPDMAFPRLNMASFWFFATGGLIFLASFFLPGGAARSGWTSYSPLAGISHGQTWWLIGMVFLISSSVLGSVNFITTIIQLRAPGMTWMRLPFFTWAQFVTAYLLLLAFPPLEAAAVMQLMDRIAHTSFFLPTGLVVAGQTMNISGGGSPLLWQHLFWFLGHPEVYIMILPALGMVGEVIANNTRKPLWSYKGLVFSTFAIGFLSFIVWAHHMYLTGMGTKVATFFQTTTVIISIPSVIIVTVLLMSLWGGSIRFNSAMLFALAFLPMFGIGGLTGIPLAFSSIVLYLHDTYYVIGHFHYVVAPGSVFAFFAGLYHWYPKVTGRRMSEFLGKIHFFGSLVCMNGIFFPMFLQGMAGVHRRWYDGGATYDLAQKVIHWNEFMSISAFWLAAFQIPFVFNFIWSIWNGRKVNDNPWEATTLEWQTPTPPPHGNFAHPPVAYRGPYEYSVPGEAVDFLPQNQKPAGEARTDEQGTRGDGMTEGKIVPQY
jgi:cytochrome c oxidase subunit 1